MGDQNKHSDRVFHTLDRYDQREYSSHQAIVLEKKAEINSLCNEKRQVCQWFI